MNQEEYLKIIELLLNNQNANANVQVGGCGGHRGHDCEICAPAAPVVRQYEQSLARFNDQSSHTVAQVQAAQAQTFQTWSAHMLRIQADIAKGA